MALAAYLMLKSFILEDAVDEDGSGKKVFVFSRKRGQRIEDEVDVFFRDKAMVNPRRYWDEVRSIKNRIHAPRRQ